MEILLEGLTQSRASGVLCNPLGLDSVMEILLEGLTQSRASEMLYNPLGSLRRSSWRGYPGPGHQVFLHKKSRSSGAFIIDW